MKRIVSLVAVVGLLSLHCSAQAAPIINSPTGLASPTSVVTFSEVALPSGTLLTNQYTAFGVTFNGVYYNPQPGFFATDPSAGNFQQPDGPTVFSNPFSIFFNQPQSAAAIHYLSNTGTSTFSAYLNNVLVETFTAPTNINESYYGFQGIVFNELRVQAPLNTNQAAIFDNIQLQAVPEPTSLALFGLVGVAAAAYYRRRKPQAV